MARDLPFRLVMRMHTTEETRLDQLRRLLAEADAPDLQSPSGKGRGHAVLHAGCAVKVSSGLFEVDSRPLAGVRADVARLAFLRGGMNGTAVLTLPAAPSRGLRVESRGVRRRSAHLQAFRGRKQDRRRRMDRILRQQWAAFLPQSDRRTR